MLKKFILKSSLLILPFVILYGINVFCYNPKEGDLVRIGYVYNNPLPKSAIEKQYDLKKNYELLSEINLSTTNTFEVVTIGDSFSEEGSLGYNNILATKGVSVLHIDRFVSKTNETMQTLIQLLNSGFFNKISTNYIVLQCVERDFNTKNTHLNFDMTLNLDSLFNHISSYNLKTPKPDDLEFFSDATLKAPLTNIQYEFEPNPRYSKIYKFESNRDGLFSNQADDLIFYQGDIDYLPIKNDSLNIQKSIEVIEKISGLALSRNIKLIMLISPDKYDLYYPYIKNNKNLEKPQFFKIYEPAEKEYINVDSYEILSERLTSEKDVYFYDDTHWSPKGAQIIADKLFEIVKQPEVKENN